MSSSDKPADAASDDLKRKFKEALDRKNATHRDGQAHLDGGSAVHASGGAPARREFRRKSG